MAVDAILGKKTRIYWSTDNITYTEFADLVEAGPPEDGEVEQIEATPLNPTNNAKEYLSALEELGEFTFSQYWNKTRYTTIRAIKTANSAGTPYYFRLCFPDNATPTSASRIVFLGNVKKGRPAGFKRNTPIQIDVIVKVTGAITYTEGS